MHYELFKNGNGLEMNPNVKSDLYVNVNMIQPYDVLLTKSKSYFAKTMSLFGYEFSHAALVIGQTYRFEAIEEGLIFNSFIINRVEEHLDHSILLSKLQNIEAAIILRHKDFSGTKPSPEHLDALYNFVKNYLYKEYPESKKLAKLFSENKLLQKIAELVIDFYKNNRNSEVIDPGPFCSELIAKIFQENGLKVFKTSIMSEEVFPDKFLNSNLIPVKNAICLKDDTKKNNPVRVQEFNKDLPLISSIEEEIKRVEIIKRGKKVIRKSNELIAKMDQLIKQHMLNEHSKKKFL